MFDELEIRGKPLATAPQPGGEPEGLAELPPSYVRFVSRFGYGRVAWLFLIFPPVRAGADSLRVRSAELHAMLLESQSLELMEYEPDGSPELIARCVPFGIGENGETLVWDPQDRDDRGELPIYVVGSKALRVTKAGRTLEEFLTLVTSEAVKRIVPGHHAFPKSFVPLPLL